MMATFNPDNVFDDQRKNRLLAWVLTAPANRMPTTKMALAAELGVSDRTLRDWEDKEDFRAAWKKAFQEIAGSLERTKAILDQLYADATDEGNDKRVMAAKLYFDISKAISPPEPEASPSRRAQDLTNAELIGMLSDSAFAELVGRDGK